LINPSAVAALYPPYIITSSIAANLRYLWKKKVFFYFYVLLFFPFNHILLSILSGTAASTHHALLVLDCLSISVSCFLASFYLLPHCVRSIFVMANFSVSCGFCWGVRFTLLACLRLLLLLTTLERLCWCVFCDMGRGSR
jgi:hypothetical protein